MRLSAFFGVFLAALLISAAPLRAHPHIWVDAVAIFLFEKGKLVGVKQVWVFDEFFAQGILDDFDTDRDGIFSKDEMVEIHDNAFSALGDFNWFTDLRLDGGDAVTFDTAGAFSAVYRDGLLAYAFELRLDEAVDPTSTEVTLGIYDPEYYVDVVFAQNDPVRFKGGDGLGCRFDLREDPETMIYMGMVPTTRAVLSCG